MPTCPRAAVVIAVLLAITPLSAARGQVITNVLLDWRARLNACEESDQRDRGALVHVAMFEAINATSGTPYRPYTQPMRADAGSSADAAAAQAAHDVIAKVCPEQKAAFATALDKSLERPRHPGSTCRRFVASAWPWSTRRRGS